MAKYRVVFNAVVEREVDVPDDFTWQEAYDFVEHQLDWYTLAHAAAAKITIDTDRVIKFSRKPAA